MVNRCALVSVYDKSNIDYFAAELVKLGFRIISTDGTAAFLNARGIETISVSDWTGFQEIMDGRVKTLHPNVHGGILADLNRQSHVEDLDKLKINPIEIVVVNLYPFEQTAANPASTEEDTIENIDIGGPAMIRSAAKNFRHVTILTEPGDYQPTLEQLRESGKTSPEWRMILAYHAFAHVESYDTAISNYFRHVLRCSDVEQHSNAAEKEEDSLPEKLSLNVALSQPLRYGENPHQKAGYYVNELQGWKQVHGKPLSYNNLLDLDAALKSILLFEQPTAMIFKHANPCGIGCGETITEAYNKAFETDPLSPFGGIIIVNRILDEQTVDVINRIFSEVIIAPEFDPAALETLRKRKDRRLVSYQKDKLTAGRANFEVKSIVSGYLVQEWDNIVTSEEGWRVATRKQSSASEMEALRFAWRSVSILKSNAIALTGADRTFGLGIGQTSRIDSTEIAIKKALQFNHDLSQAVCASDGFFPFRDSVELLSHHQIKAIIQPGGSKGDEDVIAACDELGISMILTGVRHFRH